MDNTKQTFSKSDHGLRKRGQRSKLVEGSTKLSSSFKRLLDANTPAHDGFRDMQHQPLRDDLNNNLEASGEDYSDVISDNHNKLSGKLNNDPLQSLREFNHAKLGCAPSTTNPHQAIDDSQCGVARDSDIDISIDESDKESADLTEDYHDKDDYNDSSESNEDNTNRLLDNFSKRNRQVKPAFHRLRARRRLTRQQEMIDGQREEINEKNGNSIKFPHKISTLGNSIFRNTKGDSKNSSVDSILRFYENKTTQCDENNFSDGRLSFLFRNYLPSSLLSSSSIKTDQQQLQILDKTGRYPDNLSDKKATTSSGSSIHDGQSGSDEQQPDMPASKYRTFGSGDETFASSRKLSARSKSSSSQRSAYSNRYSKLSHHYSIRPNTATSKQSFFQDLKRLLLLLLIISISCFLLFKLYQVLSEDYNYLGEVETPSILGHYEKYAVSTDAKPCAKVGGALLAKGGSAVDAAIGTLLCMGVVIPNSLGLGGGCLMTIYDSKMKQAVVIDGREVAPDYAYENMFVNQTLKASRGPLSVGIPGELAAYEKAHKMFGKLNWTDLFSETIRMAEEGVPLVEHLAYALRAKNHAQYITAPLAQVYTNPATGNYYDEGELLQQKTLANTLRRISVGGAREFYGGLTGQYFIDDLKSQGGQITLENLMKYEALVKQPLVYKLADDLTLYTQPTPGSGVVLSIILRIMKELGYYKQSNAGESFEKSSLYYHRLVEAFKFAYAQRAGLEDQPDDPKRMEDLIAMLNSDTFIKSAVQKIDNQTHATEYYGGSEYFSEDHGTAHVSVIDSEGNAVAVTSSVNLYFGSGLVSPRTGIIYNDVMDDFVSPNMVNKFKVAPSKYNRIRPGKRPLSSMVPSVFTDADGNVRLAVGGSGGSKITTAVASVSLRNCFLNEDIKQAIDGPRLHHQYLPNKIMYENNFPKDLLHALVLRGHALEPIVDRSSVIMAVASEQLGKNATMRQITANSDYRKGGSVFGL